MTNSRPRWPRFWRRVAIFALPFLASSCGLPEPPNIPKQVSDNVQRLGVWPIYPWRENVEVGDVYLVDMSTSIDPNYSSVDTTSYLLTKALSDVLESYRSQRMQPNRRFPVSGADLTTQVAPGEQGNPRYKQTVSEKGGRASLALAAFPGFSMAAIDDIAGAASSPGLLASFIGSLGFRRSVSLQVRPGAVEIAQLPVDEYVFGLRKVCLDRRTPFGDLDSGRLSVKFANEVLFHDWDRRRELHKGHIPSYEPAIFVLTKVYYLRSIKYIYSDSQAYSAALSAALESQYPSGRIPVTAPNVVVNVSNAPTSNSVESTSTGDLRSLKAEIDSIRSAITGGQNIQFGITSARATAAGIELIDSFDRPLAFGYVPFGEDYTPYGGLSSICNEINH